MKTFFLSALLTFLPAASMAMTQQEFLDARTDAFETMATVGCEELREGLPEMAGNVEALELQPRDSYEFKLATHGLKLALEKAASCITAAGDSIEWTPGAEYQALSQKKVDAGMLPYNISGRCYNGVLEYRSDWMPVPDNARFQFHYGYSPDAHATQRDSLEAQGYLPSFSSTFVDCAQNFRMQGLWIRVETK